MEAHALNMLAPWAEIVPNTGFMTGDDLLALPDDGWQYELVEGRLVRMPPSGYEAARIAGHLYAAMLRFVLDRGLGDVTPPDGGYNLSVPGRRNTTLAPDVAFIRAEHLPPHVTFDVKRAIPFAPDLAVEVASPNQHRPTMRKKAHYYLAAGTQLVWIVWPGRREVDVWRSRDMRPAMILTPDDALDGERALPGFAYPVADLFR